MWIICKGNYNNPVAIQSDQISEIFRTEMENDEEDCIQVNLRNGSEYFLSLAEYRQLVKDSATSSSPFPDFDNIILGI